MMWLIRRGLFTRKVRRTAKKTGYACRPLRRGWRFATLRAPGFDLELTKGETRLLVKLADSPSRRVTYIFEDEQWLTLRRYHWFRGFAPTPCTDRLADLSTLRAEEGTTALLFVGPYVSLAYTEQTVEAALSQGFAPPQTVFGWEIHNCRTFLQNM